MPVLRAFRDASPLRLRSGRFACALAMLLCLFVLLAADPVLAAPRERRVALVIGNSAYQRFPSLPNPRNDAEDVTAALKRAGFEVMGGTDLTRDALRDQLRLFARAAQGADAALAYYAGHGLQYKGRNYIVPVDAKLQDEFDLEYETVRVDDVVGELGRAEGARILILDACRNLPLKEKSERNPFAEAGLAKISGRGLVVAYATQANALAYDGTGRNSIFSGAFLKVIDEPGLDLPQFFQRVSIAVDRQSGGRQTPELSLSYPGQFFLNRSETDRDVWRRIREATDPALFRDFVKQFPGSDLADAANSRLARLGDAGETRQPRPDDWAALKQEQARRAEAARIRREEQGAEETRRRLAEEKAAEERRSTEQARLAEEARQKRLAEEQAMEARRLADMARAAEEARQRRLVEEKAAETRRLADLARAAEEARRKAVAEERAAEARRAAEQARAAEEARQAKLAEERAAEERRVAEQARTAEEARRRAVAEERAAEARRVAEQARAAEEARQAKLAEERAAEAVRQAEQARTAEEARLARLAEEKAAAEARRVAEQARTAEEARRKALAEERAAEERRHAEQARMADEARRKALAEEKAAEARRVAEQARATEEARQARVAEERAAEARRLVEQERAAEEARRIDLARAPAPEPPAPIGRLAALDAQVPPTAPEPRAGTLGDSRMAYNEPRAPLPETKPPAAGFPADTLDRDRLHREAEAELGRIGCLAEGADATWNAKSRAALADFARHAKLTPVPTEPTPDLLRDLKGRPAHFCPVECGPGTKLRGEACVAVEKPAPAPVARKPKPEPAVVETPRPRPQREAARPRPEPREPVERPQPRREAVQPRPRPAPVAAAPRPAPAPPQAPVSTAARPMQRPLMGVGF